MRLRLPKTSDCLSVCPSVCLSVWLSVCPTVGAAKRSKRRSCCCFIAEEHIKGRTRAIKTMRAATRTATATCAVFKWRLANFMPFIWDRQQQQPQQQQQQQERQQRGTFATLLPLPLSSWRKIFHFAYERKCGRQFASATLPPPPSPPPLPPPLPLQRSTARKDPLTVSVPISIAVPLASLSPWPQNGLNVCRLVFLLPFPFSSFIPPLLSSFSLPPFPCVVSLLFFCIFINCSSEFASAKIFFVFFSLLIFGETL